MAWVKLLVALINTKSLPVTPDSRGLKLMKIYLSDVIRIESPAEAIQAMLVKAGFVEDGNDWVRSHTPFWEEQCRKLAAKLGCEIEEVSLEEPTGEEIEEVSVVIRSVAEEPRGEEIDLAAVVRRLQAEVSSLRDEVEELKKLEGLG